MDKSRYWQQIETTFKKQRQKGLETYGQGLEENTADIIARLNHLEEELIDGLMYIQWIKDLFMRNDKMFAQVGTSLLHHKKFHDLTTGAKLCYICMIAECGGNREFAFPQSTAKGYGIPKNSLTRYIAELEREGFIMKQSGKATREPNIFSFVFGWKEQPKKS